MVTRLSSADQHNMVNLFQSLLGMDGQGIANAVLSFSGKPMTCTMSRRSEAPPFLTWLCWSAERKTHSRLRPAADDFVSQRKSAQLDHLHVVSTKASQLTVTVQQVTSRHVQTPCGFASSLTSYFDTMKHAESWRATSDSSASDALSAILDLFASMR